MNIIEEQNKNDEPNPDVTGNMDAPKGAPSAKKVYSKPTLVVISSNVAAGKGHPNLSEASITPGSANAGS